MWQISSSLNNILMILNNIGDFNDFTILNKVIHIKQLIFKSYKYFNKYFSPIVIYRQI